MADAEGYREGDASSSNEILRSIIFNKLPLLNSPGELIPNTLYYDARNCSVQAAEMTNFFGRDRIAFNNKNFGSTPSVHIPNVFFTNTSFVIAELNIENLRWRERDAGNPDDELIGGLYMPHGWGFHLIDNIVYYLGSSSVANIQISGTANMIWHMATCETKSKRDKMLNGAGHMINTFDPTITLYDPHNAISHAAFGEQVFREKQGGTVVWEDQGAAFVPSHRLAPRLGAAIIPIRLPFSSMCALEKRLSFDTKILQQPIQITLGLRSWDRVMDIFVPNDFVGLDGFTNSLKNLTFQSFQQGLSDQSLSLRNELLSNPQFSVGLPFQYIQDMRFNVANQNETYYVNITSMLNADLTTIQFALQWDRDVIPGVGNRFAPYKFIRMENVALMLNGQRLHNYDTDSYPYVYLANTVSDSWGTVKMAPWYQGVAEGQAAKRTVTMTQDCPVYEINFSRLRACAMESHMMNTPRFTNQTMQLTFTLDRGPPNFTPSQLDVAADQTGLTLLTSYYYNAVFMVGQDGGQSKLITA